MRQAGILMPITSLPSPWGIGTMGAEARNFIDFLKKAGQTYWQILPICPTGYGNSPYQSFSSFAGNPYMIDLDELCKTGLLEAGEYKNVYWGDDENCVDYGALYENRFSVLKKACGRVVEKYLHEYMAFVEAEKSWVEDYAAFMAIKEYFGNGSWIQWPEEMRHRRSPEVEALIKTLSPQIDVWKKIQFLFFMQWRALKKYGNEQGISIIGDLPIYVSLDSADVWSDPKQFQLTAQLTPIEIAGCPPDGFSEQGQIWGNPLFNWEYMKKDKYGWWINRIKHQIKIYDILRIDHFRGFDEYFAIPYGAQTAAGGVWEKGPGIELFKCLEENMGKLRIIAEDLGFLTPSVRELLRETGFPGMKVLQFAFDSRDTGSGYMPHSYTQNWVVYTGTHDNETVMEWMSTAKKEDVQEAVKYLRLTEKEGYNWGMMRSVWGSVGDIAIIPMGDILGLGAEGRINTPSTVGKNWTWRCSSKDLSEELAKTLYEEMKTYQRLP